MPFDRCNNVIVQTSHFWCAWCTLRFIIYCVAHCSDLTEWRVASLLTHTGQTYLWADAMLQITHTHCAHKIDDIDISGRLRIWFYDFCHISNFNLSSEIRHTRLYATQSRNIRQIHDATLCKSTEHGQRFPSNTRNINTSTCHNTVHLNTNSWCIQLHRTYKMNEQTWACGLQLYLSFRRHLWKTHDIVRLTRHTTLRHCVNK